MGTRKSCLFYIVLFFASAAWAGSEPDSCISHKLYHSMYRVYEVRKKVPAEGECPTQPGGDTIELEVSPPSMIESGFEPNYITFGGWLNLPGSDYHGLWHPLIFESRVTPNFEAVYGSVMVDIVPGFLVRMRAEYSHPVFTPSFMPGLRIYTWNRKKVRRLNLEKTFQDFSYWGFSINHHSNGETGEFYNADGSVDTVHGSFGTNYIIGEYHNWSQLKLPLPFLGNGRTFFEANDLSLSLEVHLPNPPGKRWFHDPVLDGQFGPIRPHFKAVIYERSPFNPSTYAKTWFNFSYAFPRKYHIAPEPALGVEGKPARFWQDHFTVDFEETLFLSWVDPLGLYFGIHAGPDYYNIWYRNYVQMIRFGIAVDPGNKFWVAGMK
ncbi:MAG: hypothetical protein JWO30_3186 [Fibrobacteres bacterium]|nr:hypothetical protein [Fibrobacterota bacterium]